MQLGGSRFFRQLDSTSPVDCCRRRKDGSGAKLQTATVVVRNFWCTSHKRNVNVKLGGASSPVWHFVIERTGPFNTRKQGTLCYHSKCRNGSVFESCSCLVKIDLSM